jgi:hypothetical protein
MSLTPVTKPTLVYSHFAGLAEPARLLLEDAGVDYDYVAVSNWDELKVKLQAIGTRVFISFSMSTLCACACA